MNELNAAVARLLFPEMDDLLNENNAGLFGIKDYATDLNAAVEACLTLGYAPKIRPAGWGDYSVGLRCKNDWVSEHIPLVTNDLSPHEITQAIATALCEALREAEGVE